VQYLDRFLGRYGSGKPVIGILGEFDALSGLSQQACTLHKQAISEVGADTAVVTISWERHLWAPQSQSRNKTLSQTVEEYLPM